MRGCHLTRVFKTRRRRKVIIGVGRITRIVDLESVFRFEPSETEHDPQLWHTSCRFPGA